MCPGIDPDFTAPTSPAPHQPVEWPASPSLESKRRVHPPTELALPEDAHPRSSHKVLSTLGFTAVNVFPVRRADTDEPMFECYAKGRHGMPHEARGFGADSTEATRDCAASAFAGILEEADRVTASLFAARQVAVEAAEDEARREARGARRRSSVGQPDRDD